MRIKVRYLGLSKKDWITFSREYRLHGGDYVGQVYNYFLQERCFNFNHDPNKPIFSRDIRELVEKRTGLKVPAIQFVEYKNEILQLY